MRGGGGLKRRARESGLAAAPAWPAKQAIAATLLAGVLATLLGACGSSARPAASSSTAASSSPSSSSTGTGAGTTPSETGTSGSETETATSGSATAAASANASRPGCGELCQNAGPAAGNGGPGAYECSGGCSRCPDEGCLTLLSSSATVAGAQLAVRVHCAITRPCVGALVLWKPETLSSSGRLGGSDIDVPAGETSEVPIAVNSIGEQMAETAGGFRVEVLVVLEGYGYETEHSLVMHT